MNEQGDRMARAGNYVLGLMSDEDRERAEHDLEVDASFRDAVVEIAQRMRVLPAAGARGGETGWQSVKARIAAMPQMRALADAQGHASPLSEQPVAFGRRRSDLKTAARPAVRRTGGPPVRPQPDRRGVVVTAGFAAAFVLGYLTALIAPPF